MNLPFQWKVAFGILATVLIGLSLSSWLTLRIVRRGWPDALPASVQTDLLLAFGTALLIAMGVGIGIARRLTRPLSEMTQLAKHLATGGLGHRIRSAPPDEVGQLGDVLNQITDQLQAKIHEVSEDRAQLLAMLTAMVEGVMVLDSKGQVLLINPALERMFGLHSQPARGRPYWELIRHPDLNDLTARVLERRTGQTGELSLALSGRTLRVEVSVAGGRREHEACVVLVFHDITDLRRLETVRKDFVANVSHELRTPLTSIKGYVEALLDGAKDDPETMAKFLDIILRQSNRLNLILDDLLQLSQIESGVALFKRDLVSPGNVVERSLAIIQPLADKKGHRMHLEVAEGLPGVIGDEDRLVQVLTNLLDNAVKYTPDGGTITVRLQALEPTPGAEVGSIELSVADTGIGIPEGDRPRVFERFYRVDKARSRELGGTGLGLAIVKHIVEQHDGQVWVEGNQPAGSRFVVRLPAARPGQLTAPQTNLANNR